MKLKNIKLPDENKHKDFNLYIEIATFILVIFLGIIIIFISQKNYKNNVKLKNSNLLKVAKELEDDGLYFASIDTYMDYLNSKPNISNEEKAQLYFNIGELYFKLNNYEMALKYYYLSEAIYPLKGIESLLHQHELTALRRLQKYSALENKLNKITSLNKNEQNTEKYIAKIGNQYITLADLKNSLNAYINTMFFNKFGMLSLTAEEIQKQKEKLYDELSKPQNLKDYFSQWIFYELLYREALSKNVLKNPQILNTLNLLEKNFIAEEYLRESIINNIKVNKDNLKKFYEKNKNLFVVKDYINADLWQFNTEKKAKDFIKNFDVKKIKNYKKQENYLPDVKIVKGEKFPFSNKPIPFEKLWKNTPSLYQNVLKKDNYYYVLYTSHKIKGKTLDFNKDFEQIKKIYVNQLVKQKMTKLFNELKNKYKVEIYDENIK